MRLLQQTLIKKKLRMSTSLSLFFRKFFSFSFFFRVFFSFCPLLNWYDCWIDIILFASLWLMARKCGKYQIPLLIWDFFKGWTFCNQLRCLFAWMFVYLYRTSLYNVSTLLSLPLFTLSPPGFSLPECIFTAYCYMCCCVWCALSNMPCQR